MNATLRFGRGNGNRVATLDTPVDVSFFDRLTKSDASTADFLGAKDAHWVLNTPAVEPAALEVSNVSVLLSQGVVSARHARHP